MRFVRVNLDAIGMCASTLCMIHCLVFPLLLAALPMWQYASGESNQVGRGTAGTPASTSATGAAVADSPGDCCESECCAAEGGSTDVAATSCCATPTDFWIHVGLLAAVAPLGIVAWGMGYRHHRRAGVLCLGLLGVLLLCGALLFGHQLLGGRGEQAMTVLGSICMVSAHLWNRRQCKCCRTPDLARVVEIDSAETQSQTMTLPNGGVL